MKRRVSYVGLEATKYTPAQIYSHPIELRLLQPADPSGLYDPTWNRRNSTLTRLRLACFPAVFPVFLSPDRRRCFLWSQFHCSHPSLPSFLLPPIPSRSAMETKLEFKLGDLPSDQFPRLPARFTHPDHQAIF
ncbi:hypothetical protein Dsin_018753 [Dipteronia sinensis]|uniref:Uncharacterized protein n=1 Tax=Dipteronia sinensis TaxID=43782 RepID=A0AAE0A5W8_9ROSI|nr:hypothetical protein Dsin_018753 [Dipteronia sinensis]